MARWACGVRPRQPPCSCLIIFLGSSALLCLAALHSTCLGGGMRHGRSSRALQGLGSGLPSAQPWLTHALAERLGTPLGPVQPPPLWFCVQHPGVRRCRSSNDTRAVLGCGTRHQAPPGNQPLGQGHYERRRPRVSSQVRRREGPAPAIGNPAQLPAQRDPAGPVRAAHSEPRAVRLPLGLQRSHGHTDGINLQG